VNEALVAATIRVAEKVLRRLDEFAQTVLSTG
jgi:hypothetical protein